MFVEKGRRTLMTYTNELEVEVDFSDVDPSLLEESEDDTDSTVATLSTSDDVQINQTLRLILLIQMNRSTRWRFWIK
jgi:hypothetical protein